MIKVRESSFFGYPVTDLARARAFYEGVLGLKVSQEPGPVPWMEFDLGNATLGLGAYGERWKSSPDGALVALEVEDFDAAIAELKAKNVPFSFDGMETPVCHFAIVRDPDGNAVMIHQRKPHNK
jgi:predicted enzyme related to lactoylglutathione lyase